MTIKTVRWATDDKVDDNDGYSAMDDNNDDDCDGGTGDNDDNDDDVDNDNKRR